MPKSKEAEAPWEQQPNESAKAFEAFAIYRDMGADRSIRAVARRLGKSKTQIEKWSRAHDWVERVRAYDRNLDREARAEAVKNIKQMTKRHIGIAMNLQKKALDALKDLDPDSLTPKMLLAFLSKATEIERLNRLAEAGMDESGLKDADSETEIIIEGDDDAEDQD